RTRSLVRAMIRSRFRLTNSYNITSPLRDESHQNRFGHAFEIVLASPGSGRATNRRRHGLAISRAQRFARLTRALSVAMPVLAYICRYSFEISTKASRALNVGVQRERVQIRRRL